MTLKEIVYEILLDYRASTLSQSEAVSNRLVESWVHAYRERLIKQMWDKGYPLDQFIQEANCIEIVPVNANDCCDEDASCIVMRTAERVPDFVRSDRNGMLLTSVGSITGGPRYDIVTESYAQYFRYRRYVGGNTVVYWKEGYLYVVTSNKLLDKISFKGIANNPTDFSRLKNSCTNTQCYTNDSEYPVTKAMVSDIKELIFAKELRIQSMAPSDTINDSNNNVKHNTYGAESKG